MGEEVTFEEGKVNIILMCVNAMSSGTLAKKMSKEADKRGLDANIKAVAGWGFMEEDISQLDVVLLSPQAKHYEKDLKEKTQGYDIKIEKIDYQTYGLVDGEKCLDLALEAIEK